MAIFLHELVDVVPGRGDDYADSMAEHHGTSPARAGKRDTMLGLFVSTGLHGRAPVNVNLWRTGEVADVAAQLARQFEPREQDAGLEAWWKANVDLRTGGCDRFVESTAFSPDVADLRAGGVRPVLFLHELVRTAPSERDAFLDDVAGHGVARARAAGALLVGAYRVLLSNGEVLLLWGYPDAASFARHQSSAGGASSGVERRESLLLRPRHYLTSPWHDADSQQ